METVKVITLDLLNEQSVSLLIQEFEVDEDGNIIKQTGENTRQAYYNTPSSRRILELILPEDKYTELLSVWGDSPTLEDYKPYEPSIDEMKTKLISDMSKTCNNIITNGFDAILSDNVNYHFSLKIEDQLMIQALMLKAKAGETVLPYHADGSSCKYFTVDEVMLLYSNMEKIITYNTTYFNSLRDYINSINTKEELFSISYGIDIPEEYQSEVLKSLLSKEK